MKQARYKKFKYSIHSDMITIDKYTGKSEEVHVPESIKGLPVITIGERAFFENSKVRRIVISSAINIKARAFESCENLITVTLPDDLKTISRSVFENCTNLLNISIPKSVTTIYRSAFKNCISLKSIKLPESLTVLNAEIFRGCVTLERVDFPSHLEKICQSAFEGCRELIILKSHHLNENALPILVSYLGEAAFKNCISLKTIELPEPLTVLTVSAFAGCVSLESIGIPYDLTRIRKSAFEGCSNLKHFYYFSKRGISDVMETDRNLREDQLPALIDYIGAKAFKDCASLEEITIPYKVKVIKDSVFSGCTSLKNVHIHNSLVEIKAKAFSGCVNLWHIKLPLLSKKIAVDAFEGSMMLVCEEASYAYQFAIENNLPVKAVAKLEDLPQLSSQMIPYGTGEFIDLDKHTSFYSDDALPKIVEKFEMRMPSYHAIERPALPVPNPVKSARYTFENGVYHNKNKSTSNRATIMMTGDLMSRFQQQKMAYQGDTYDFEDSFYFVKNILAQSDFAVGNMETMISPSAPFTCENEYVDTRAHLNAPESFLAAIRNASFDAVVNAQNHIYDTGVLGVFETLDMHNKYELIHTGAYASESDKRYILVNVNGIKIAILAYFDGARQLMKKVNFTKVGREVLFNIHQLEQIDKDVQDAKAEGAEFIIAYCHWGREYTHMLTARQKGFAKEVAYAGVDFIFGAHSHCVQPYDEIHTEDNRIVPVIYSGGSFLSDIDIKAPITRDTLISELILVKDNNGRVAIESNGYYPCRILEMNQKNKVYVVTPTQLEIEELPKKTNSLRMAEMRIEKVLTDGITKLEPSQFNLKATLSNLPFDDATSDGDFLGNLAFDLNKERASIDGIPIVTIEELCRALKIEVPQQYQDICGLDVIETPLFQGLEGASQLLKKCKMVSIDQSEELRRLDARVRAFQKKYDIIVNMDGTHEQLLSLLIAYVYVYQPRGFIAKNYFENELYRKTLVEADLFINKEESSEILRICYDKYDAKYVENKFLFHQTFGKHIKRDFLSARSTTIEEFKEFCKRNEKFFAKPNGGSIGQGADVDRYRIIEVAEDVEGLYRECVNDNLLLEGLITQHPDMAAFNESAVNTLRLCTLVKANGEPIVTNAIIRTGAPDSLVSNGGIQAAIDIKTGKITTHGSNTSRENFEIHPASGKVIKGSQIPYWDKVIESVLDAALIVPSMHHLGWDIAITAEGNIEYIEANTLPDFDAGSQSPDQIGKKPVYLQHIKDISALKSMETSFDYQQEENRNKYKHEVI